MTKKTHFAGRGVLLRSAFANWVGLAVEVMLAFFLTPFIIGSLGAVVYGVWSLANSVIGYLGLIDLGVRASLGRFVNQHLARDDHDAVNEVISTSFVFLTASAAIVALSAALLGVYFEQVFPKTPAELASRMVIVLPVLAYNLWLAFIGAIYRNILAAFDRFDMLNVIGFAGAVARASLVVWVLKQGYGLIGLVFAVSVSSTLVCVLSYFAARRVYPTLSSHLNCFRLERIREMWRFGVAAFLTRSASEVVYQSDQIILMALLGPRAVAIYGVANMLILYAQRVVEQVGGVMSPSVMKTAGVGDLPSLRKAFILHPRAAFFVGIPFYLGFIVFGGTFIRLWVGPEFEEAVPVLIVLSLAELAALFTGLGGTVLFGLGRLRFNLYCSLAEAILNVMISIMLIVWTPLGIIGAASGTLVAALICRGLAHPLYTTRALEMRYSDYLRATAPRVLAAVGAAYVIFWSVNAVVKPTNWLGFGVAVLIASAGFVAFDALIMFGRQETARLLNSLPLRRRKSA